MEFCGYLLCASMMFLPFNSLISAEDLDLPVTFYIARHGQTDWNAGRRMQGHTDIPLNQTGKKEAEELGLKLQMNTFSAVYSSDLKRAFETAEIIIKNHQPSLIVNKDVRLRERFFGAWEGKFFADYDSAIPELKVDVENDLSVQQRVFELLEHVADNARPGSNILVVSHGGILKNMIERILDTNCTFDDVKIKNTGYFVATYSRVNGWAIKKLEGIEIRTLVPLK